MPYIFLILAAITIAGTAAAMTLRSAIHCILALTIGLVGLAALYLLLGAQFVGFTQILVYVGAVAILAVFAIMMTQGPGNTTPTNRTSLEGYGLQPVHKTPEDSRGFSPGGSSILSTNWPAGVIVAAAVFAILAWAIHSIPKPTTQTPQPEVSVNQIGAALMHHYVLPLEIMGLLLTAALIGAVILAIPEKKEPQ